jgi:hypothetical protein
MINIWACLCGYEKECRQEDLAFGAVYQCESCKKVFGCVYPHRGGKAWIEISKSDVEFHNLLEDEEF